MPYGGGGSITPKTESAIKTTAAAGVDEVQTVAVVLNAMKRQVVVIGGNVGRKLGSMALEGQISRREQRGWSTHRLIVLLLKYGVAREMDRLKKSHCVPKYGRGTPNVVESPVHPTTCHVLQPHRQFQIYARGHLVHSSYPTSSDEPDDEIFVLLQGEPREHGRRPWRRDGGSAVCQTARRAGTGLRFKVRFDAEVANWIGLELNINTIFALDNRGSVEFSSIVRPPPTPIHSFVARQARHVTYWILYTIGVKIQNRGSQRWRLSRGHGTNGGACAGWKVVLLAGMLLLDGRETEGSTRKEEIFKDGHFAVLVCVLGIQAHHFRLFDIITNFARDMRCFRQKT
ncbi:hypothetical protein IW262DRAFT_1486788 [Armillaria fumosa]|nr:hypothetical protein IW262DRAFT_1486788 [Armillaria fumosa]